MEKKYFRGDRRSELQELREELQNVSKDKRKNAIKKIIGAMTIGKDVSSLFPDVVNCIQTNNIELKKLVYLYVINYAKVQPELAILAVNTFCKDARDRNPLIRALAIRTMGYIRLTAITEYLVEPLKRCQVDADPYVRKTAAICIAKLYGISPSLVIEEDFLSALERMLSDTNSMVVANAVATLVEISESSDQNIFSRILNKDESCVDHLLSALNECIEWGQVYILDSLVFYRPKSESDAKKCIEAVLPRFSHINPAVVMSAIRVVLKMMEKITDKEYLKTLQNKLAAPLVTLASLEPEIQYVSLRSILLIIEKWPRLLEHHVRAFFCKFRDPLYVKIEKLDIMVKLATTTNYSSILYELKEYAADADLDFVRQAIRAVGCLAIRLESALSACMEVLKDLLRLKIVHVTEECTVVFRDLLRAYSHVFSKELFSLCANSEYLQAAESKAALIWIVGQYASEIPDASEYILNMAEIARAEPYNVQLCLLTSAIKVTLRCGTEDLAARVLRKCGLESSNPDVRDRADMYLRLLDSGSDIASKVVLSDFPRVGEPVLDKDVLKNLLNNLGHVSSIYHLPAWAVSFKDVLSIANHSRKNEISKYSSSESDELFRKDYVKDTFYEEDENDYTDDDDEEEEEDLFAPSVAYGYACKDEIVIQPFQKGAKNGQMGLEVSASIYRDEERIFLRMALLNKTAALITLQALQFNKNPFGLSPSAPLDVLSIPPEKTKECRIPLSAGIIPSNAPPEVPMMLQVAIKTNVDVFYFRISYELPIILVHDVKIQSQQFQKLWRSFKVIQTTEVEPHTKSSLVKRLRKIGIVYVGSDSKADKHADKVPRGREQEASFCFYAQTTNSLALLSQISGTELAVKAEAAVLTPLFLQTIVKALAHS